MSLPLLAWGQRSFERWTSPSAIPAEAGAPFRPGQGRRLLRAIPAFTGGTGRAPAGPQPGGAFSSSSNHPRIHGGSRKGPCGTATRLSLFKLLEPSPRSRGKPDGSLCGTATRPNLSAYLPGTRTNESRVSGIFTFFLPRYSVVKQATGSRTLRASCDRDYAIGRCFCQVLFLANTLFSRHQFD